MPQAFEPGGVFVRFLALILDGIIVSLIQLPVMFLVGAVMVMRTGVDSAWNSIQNMQSGSNMVLIQIANIGMTTLLNYIYYGWFYQKKGATPGKMLFGLTVVDATTGTYLSWGQTFMREIVGKTLDLMTLGIGMLVAVFRADKKTLHDWLAGTQVLRSRK